MSKVNFILLFIFIATYNVDCRVRIPSTSEMEQFRNDFKRFLIDSVKSSERGFIQELSRLIDSSRDTCQNFDEKLNVTIADVMSCQERIKLGSSTICNTVKAIITKCSKPAKQLLSDCLPVESKDLPLLTEKILFGLIKQVCDTTLEEVIEFFNPCQFKKDFRSFQPCRELENSLPRKFPNTKQACQLLNKVKECSNDVHSSSCTNPITLNAFANFHKTIEQETRDICLNNAANEV